MPTLSLRIEPLCAHHDLAHFKSGLDRFDDDARLYASRVRALEVDTFDSFVVVRTDTEEVVGITVMRSLWATATDVFGDLVDGPWFNVPLFLVSQDAQGSRVASTMVRHAQSVRNRWFSRRSDYLGDLMAVPADARSILRLLSRQGFRTLRDVGEIAFLYRPRTLDE